MKLLDLFSGIGGFSLAAQWAGIETIGFCERDKFCQQVLVKNFPNIPIHDDIKTLSMNPSPYHHKVDIITAGFPCQPFSVAGKKKGKDDDRYLWPEVIRLIRECKPTWFIGENVPGIIPMLDPILEDLEGEGYDWRAFLIPASSVGAPHKRERLWIIANSNRSQRSQGTAYNETESKRSKRKIITTKAGHVISNTDSITGIQAHSCIMPSGEGWEAWKDNSGKHWVNESIFDWAKDQPPIPGVDDGLPFIVDRNKALGNSIVPQIPYLLFKILLTLP